MEDILIIHSSKVSKVILTNECGFPKVSYETKSNVYDFIGGITMGITNIFMSHESDTKQQNMVAIAPTCLSALTNATMAARGCYQAFSDRQLQPVFYTL